MHCGKRELCYLAQTLCLLGESNLGFIENSLMSLRGQKKMYHLKKTPPSIHDFMDERSLKLTNIFNLKFDCQNLPFKGSLASSKLNPFLFLQELKINLETISKIMQ